MKNLAALLAAALLAGCSVPPGCTGLPGGARYCLQASGAAPAFAVRQQVRAHFKDRDETLIADVENGADGLSFVGLTPFGLTVFQAHYDNLKATAARMPDTRLSAENLLGMLQLALWPPASVQRGLGETAQVEDAPGRRRIASEGTTLMEMRHDDSPPPYRQMHIDWPALGLELDIRTLDAFDAVQEKP